jgi:hypothetical protein
MKREGYPQRLTIRVSAALWSEIAAAAVASGLTPSQLLRVWCERGAKEVLNPEAVQTSVQTPAQRQDSRAVQRMDRLEEGLEVVAQAVRSLADRVNQMPVQTPVQISALPAYPPGRSVRWNLWMLEPIRDELMALAAARACAPSSLIQELLWKALRSEDPTMEEMR